MSIPRNTNISSWTQVNNEIKYIHDRLTQLHSNNVKSGTTIVIGEGGGIVYSGSGGGSSSLGVVIRTGMRILSAGTTYIPFVAPIGTSSYNLIIEIYNTAGILMPQPTISSVIQQTSDGFTITVGEASVIKYTAVSIP